MTTTIYTLPESSSRRMTEAERNRRVKAARRAAMMAIFTAIVTAIKSVPSRAKSIGVWAHTAIPNMFIAFIALTLFVAASLMAIALMNAALLLLLKVSVR